MSTNNTSISFESQQVSVIGSFGRRILAISTDGLMLYAFGHVVGTTFFGSISLFGPWGRLVGFCIALIYFATMESEVGGGQTLGKRLFQLRVVSAQGILIPWGQSAVRYAICAIPFFLVVSKYTVPITNWAILSLIIFSSIGIGGSTLYLLVFNRRTRQGLHDIAVKTYVVKSKQSGPVETEPIWGMHWCVISGLLTLIAFTALSKGISVDAQHKNGYVSQHLQDERLIEKLGGVNRAEVQIWTPIPSDASVLGNFLSKKEPVMVTVQWTGEKKSREPFADQVASIVLQNDPRVQKQNLIQIKIGRSYDLGIASGNDYQNFTHTPAEWGQRVPGARTSTGPDTNSPVAEGVPNKVGGGAILAPPVK